MEEKALYGVLGDLKRQLKEEHRPPRKEFLEERISAVRWAIFELERTFITKSPEETE